MPVSPSKSTSQPPMPTADQVAEDLRKVVGDLVRKVRSEANTPSSAHSETLGFLGRNGSASISELAAFRHVKHQSMRLVVEQLASQDLVSRAPDPTDGRRQVITLTPQGSAALQTGRSLRSEWLATQLQHTATAAELDTLRSAIQILERVLNTDGPSG